MAMLTEVINKFEKLNMEANKKIQATFDSENQADVSAKLALTMSHSQILKFLFSKLRYMFARFSKIVNYINRLKSGWK